MVARATTDLPIFNSGRVVHWSSTDDNLRRTVVLRSTHYINRACIIDKTIQSTNLILQWKTTASLTFGKASVSFDIKN